MNNMKKTKKQSVSICCTRVCEHNCENRKTDLFLKKQNKNTRKYKGNVFSGENAVSS